MPPRQRYRATQSNNPMYDVVEDDQYSQDEHFDTFGMPPSPFTPVI